MAEQRRIGYKWNLRTLMAQKGLWKSTELVPLLKARGIVLSESQVYRLVTSTPERFQGRTFAALCDILDCTPNDLFELTVEMRAANRVNEMPNSKEAGSNSGSRKPISMRLSLIEDE